jgi:tetratricopeptide (TPR) repeat protein
MLLNQEIDDLQEGVRAMKEEDLVKSVAKRKVAHWTIQVIYNVSRQGELELIYALIALADYYLNRGMLESAFRAIEQSRDIRVIGDNTFLMGNILMKKGLKKEAMGCFEQCIQQ